MTATDQSIGYKGIHHIALATTQLEETQRFYHDVLHMEVSDIAPSRQGRGRHCLVLLKVNDDDIWGFHFFEREAEPAPAPLLHIALRLNDRTSAEALRTSLSGAQVTITDIPELGSFLFADNNGIALEATWPKD